LADGLGWYGVAPSVLGPGYLPGGRITLVTASSQLSGSVALFELSNPTEDSFLIASALPSRPDGEPLRRPRPLASAGAGTAFLSFCLSSLCLSTFAQPSGDQGFTLRQVMSAPFDSDLTAAPAGDAFAWVANAEGKRNLWVAVRSAGGEYVSRAITDYPLDDGQDISDVTWSPDAQSILYVRGGSSVNPEKRAPNPAHLPGGAEQEVWLISADGGSPRKVAPGASPTFSPSGDTITWFAEEQIWHQGAADIGNKPAQSVHVYGDCTSFSWSPDGTKLAFVSDRESHSFIGVYSPQRNTLNFVDPGPGHDRYPMWSLDSEVLRVVDVPVVHTGHEVHNFLLYRDWYAAYSASAEFFQRHLKAPAPVVNGDR
jgi:hypothetical protein